MQNEQAGLLTAPVESLAPHQKPQDAPGTPPTPAPLDPADNPHRLYQCALCGAQAARYQGPDHWRCHKNLGGCGRDTIPNGPETDWAGRPRPEPTTIDLADARQKWHHPVAYDLKRQHPAVRKRTLALARTMTLGGERLGPAAHWSRVHWELPHQRQARPGCSQWHQIAHGTLPHLHVQPYIATCKTAGCNVCRPARYDDDPDLPRGACWEHDRAHAITYRLESWLHAYNRGYTEIGVKDAVYTAYHVVVSPPQEAAKSLMGWEPGYLALRKGAVRALALRGVDGGTMIFHHQRCPGRFNLRIKPVDGPHWHILTPRKNPVNRRLTGRAYRRDGWIIKDLGRRNTIYGTAYYCLTHAATSTLESVHPAVPKGTGIVQTRRRGPTTVTWFGKVSYNQWLCTKRPNLGLLCRTADERIPFNDWMRLAHIGFDPPPPFTGPMDLRDHPLWVISDEPTFSPGRDATQLQRDHIGEAEFARRLEAARVKVARDRKAAYEAPVGLGAFEYVPQDSEL